jgi:hypothetical protein
MAEGTNFVAGLESKAKLWRSRKPSGKFILHWLPRRGWCPVHWRVTKYHHCSVTCSIMAFRCTPECSKSTCG